MMDVSIWQRILRSRRRPTNTHAWPWRTWIYLRPGLDDRTLLADLETGLVDGSPTIGPILEIGNTLPILRKSCRD